MKLQSVALLCAALATGPTRYNTLEQSSMQASGAFFALSVTDVKTSTAWYSDKLGLKVAREIPEAKVVILEGDGLIVELIQQDGAAPKTNGPSRGIMKAGFIARDYEAALARLRIQKADIAYGPFPAQPGQRANVIIRDNDGNLIQLFGP